MNSQIYTILKPEIKNHLDFLDSTLIDNGFEVVSRHPIDDWVRLSEAIYAPQLEANPSFAAGSRAYFWFTTHFFGNDSTVFVLDHNSVSLQEKLDALAIYKQRLRKDIEKVIAGGLKIFLDMNKVNIPGTELAGRRMEVGSYIRDSPVLFKERWEDIYFKYIHAPNPYVDVLSREWKVLQQCHVFDQVISEEKWSFMKRLKTLTFSFE